MIFQLTWLSLADLSTIILVRYLFKTSLTILTTRGSSTLNKWRLLATFILPLAPWSPRKHGTRFLLSFLCTLYSQWALCTSRYFSNMPNSRFLHFSALDYLDFDEEWNRSDRFNSSLFRGTELQKLGNIPIGTLRYWVGSKDREEREIIELKGWFRTVEQG